MIHGLALTLARPGPTQVMLDGHRAVVMMAKVHLEAQTIRPCPSLISTVQTCVRLPLCSGVAVAVTVPVATERT